MSLYKESDIQLVKDNIAGVLEKVRAKQLEIFEPTGEEQKTVRGIIKNYIIENKKKLYGGYALHLLITNKNPDDGLYQDTDSIDYDIYSSDPILDLTNICNLLHDKGYKNVVGREAMHKETYSIFVNYQLYCDLSYMPAKLYNKLPTIQINNILVSDPYFIYIDYLRMMSDPLVSYLMKRTVDKSFERFYLLQKYYPLKKMESPLKFDYANKIQNVLQTTYNFLSKKEGVVFLGFVAYNKMMEAVDDKQITPIPYYECILADYQKDGLSLLNHLKTEYENIVVTEHYPFFQYFDFHAKIFYDNKCICVIYGNNKMCVPYKIYDGIKIASFAATLRYLLITMIKAYVDNDKSLSDQVKTVIWKIYSARQTYLKNHTIFDDSVFQDFIVDCLGETITPDREQRLLIEYRKAKGKKYRFAYEPSTDERKTSTVNYIFANSSGNPINNPKNLKLVQGAEPEEIRDIEENENTQ